MVETVPVRSAGHFVPDAAPHAAERGSSFRRKPLERLRMQGLDNWNTAHEQGTALGNRTIRSLKLHDAQRRTDGCTTSGGGGSE